MRFRAIACILTTSLAVACGTAAAQPVQALLTGGAFEAALARPLGASWQQTPLRDVLRSVRQHARIAILLDRRIDPEQSITLDAGERSLHEALQKIASQADARLRVVGNVAYLAAPDAAARIRTLVAVSEEQRRQYDRNVPISRRRKLTLPQTIEWEDLATPAEITEQVAARHGLRLENPGAIPHDLWTGAILPDVTIDQSLSLLLNQFDLIHKWYPDLAAIQIVSVVHENRVQRRYRPRGMSPAAAAEAWSRDLPDIETEVRGLDLIVRGTFADHDAIEDLVAPPRAAPRVSGEARRNLLKRLPSKARVQNVPARALIGELERAGIRFKYDEPALSAAGIDLDRQVSLDVSRPEDFLPALTEPLGLKYDIDGLTVTLSPK